MSFHSSFFGNSVALIMSLILFLPLSVMGKSLYCERADSALKVLDKEIANRHYYRANKEHELSRLKNTLGRANSKSVRFELLEDIYEEYSCYQFDSAFVYARTSFDLAKDMGDSVAVNRSYLMLMKCFSSVGLLKESSDLKNKIDTTYLSHSDKLNFLRHTASLYINLNSFLGSNSPIGCFYEAKLKEFTEKALAECGSDSILLSVMQLEQRKYSGISPTEEIKGRQKLIDRYDLPPHELAMQYCAMGRAYIEIGDTDAAIFHTALSAIYDQRLCNNETMSTYILADLMHHRGDIERASRYIYAALDESNFLNSRLRKIEINAILPDIVDTRLNMSQKQKHVAIVISSVILALLLWVILLWLKVRRRNRSLSQAHEEARKQTAILNDTNARLTAINGKLEEADEIKNRCIMESLYANQSFVNVVETTGRTIERKIKARQFDDIAGLLRSIGVKEESRRILSTFDSIFLSIFPAFVECFNALLDSDGRMDVNDDGTLPTELRIYALMRLGISDTVIVAKYLGISQNTIYVYKARIKAHAIVRKDDFDDAVMDISR